MYLRFGVKCRFYKTFYFGLVSLLIGLTGFRTGLLIHSLNSVSSLKLMLVDIYSTKLARLQLS